MANNLVRTVAKVARVPCRALSTTASTQQEMTIAEREKFHPRIGSRDIVGFGFNGTASYMDRVEFPFPAIRFRENTGEVAELREKEKGDWKNLSIEEKRVLYRASFCQTFAEMGAPSGDWRFITGGVIIAVSIAGWVCLFVKKYVYNPLPSTITKEWQQAELQRRIIEKQGAIDGGTAEYFRK